MAWLIVDVVIASDVAWIVIRQLALVKTLWKCNALIGQQAILYKQCDVPLHNHRQAAGIHS